MNCYDRKGKLINLDEWSRLLSEPGYQLIARDEVSSGVEVITVWHGLKNILFETKVFGGTWSGEMENYTTETEAVAGHAAMVERVKAET